MPIPSRDRIKSAAVEFVESLVPVLLIHHGIKKPIAASETKTPGEDDWAVYADPDEVAEAIDREAQVPNIGVILNPKNDSSVIAVDIDGQAGLEKAKELGITKESGAWQVKTGRGGLIILYFHSGEPLKRVVKAQGLPLDLLSNGYAIVPPSSTHLFHDKRGQGGLYRWVEGRSPRDIPYVELETPPDALLQFWRESSGVKGRPSATQAPQQHDSALDALLAPIEHGARNDTLASLAGWFRRKGADARHIEALLAAINTDLVTPTLGPEEVRSIARSVGRYDAADSHFRGVDIAPIN